MSILLVMLADMICHRSQHNLPSSSLLNLILEKRSQSRCIMFIGVSIVTHYDQEKAPLAFPLPPDIILISRVGGWYKKRRREEEKKEIESFYSRQFCCLKTRLQAE